MELDRGHDAARDQSPAYSTGWAARRIGVAAATLRSWDRRYGVGPTGRTVGGHRRYLSHDLDRLGRMRRLMLAGLTTAEAARVSADPGSGSAVPVVGRRPGWPRAPGRADGQVQRLANAATNLDQTAVESLLRHGLRQRGVVPAWNELILPVLVGMGERYARHGDGVEAEHLFTECTRTALSAVTGRSREWDSYPPVLLACVDQEQHSLALNALGAALAEIGCPCRCLGASVPLEALVSAARRVAPRAIFIWAQTPGAGHLADLPPHRPLTPVVVGGPGWSGLFLPASVTCVDSLAAAVAAVSHRSIVSAH